MASDLAAAILALKEMYERSTDLPDYSQRGSRARTIAILNGQCEGRARSWSG